MLPPALRAQAWQWAESYGGGNESCEVVTATADGGLFAGGTFDETLMLDGKERRTFGGADIWIARLDADGGVRWAATAGGPSDETITAMTIAPNGDLICAGSYWQRAFFDGQELEAKANIKGLFIARYAPDGALQWVRGIDGTKLKEVTDVECDQAGNIYVSGFFEEQLLIEQTTLQANGVSDLFLLRMDGQGRLSWAVHEGLTGNTRAITLALTPEEDLVVGGYFDDTTRIADAVFTANTFDRDVFLARYSKEGEGQWARKAGGVHPDEIAAVEVNAAGDIYATGWLVGVMTLSETISIQSQTGQSDFYLLRYAADGTPLLGRAMGSRFTPQETTDLFCTGEGVVLSGFYSGEMTIDGTTLSAGGGFGSFIAGFSPAAELQWTKNLPAEEAVFVNGITPAREGALHAGGSFRGAIRLDGFSLQDQEPFDFFLGTLAPQATDLEKVPEAKTAISVFPVPAGETLTIRTPAVDFQVALFDLYGRQLWQGQNQTELSVAHLPAGSYFLVYRDRTGVQQRRLLISR